MANAQQKAIRPSKQGSRRRFDIRRRRRTEYELRLEMGSTVKVWKLAGPVPSKTKGSRTAVVLEDQPSSVLENPPGHEPPGSDYGTYELIDGSYKSGLLEVFLNGEKFRGELTLSREERNKWRIGKTASAATSVPSTRAETRTKRSEAPLRRAGKA